MQRIALGIEYGGAAYSGWQTQRHKPSVQTHLEQALTKVANHTVSVICAGRTDAGVHATGQVVHFDTLAVRPSTAWVRGVNTYLPSDIRVCWSKEVPNHFNARRSAFSRRYCYVMMNRAIPSGIMRRMASWVLPPLDVNLMQEGARYLLGQHDFTSFRATQCQAKSPLRTIHAIEILRKGEYVILDITANAFLHHMVRNIAGTLIQVGTKKCPPSWVKEALDAKDRRLAGHTSTPEGLYLIKVSYISEFDIPTLFATPWFFEFSCDW